MLAIKPVPESEASDEIQSLYRAIKQILGTNTTPLLFQYLAVFPAYLSYIWQQLERNLDDGEFKKQTQEIEDFALSGVSEIYTPNAATKVFIQSIEGRVEQLNLLQFTTSLRHTNAILYLLTLAIRESVKGMHLGIKKLEERVSPQEHRIFEDLTEGFFSPVDTQPSTALTPTQTSVDSGNQQRLATAPYSDFFKLMQWEMNALVKREDYLFRRVALERFALTKLDTLPHPLESSFATVIRYSGGSEHFQELLYILAELFPTQTPYKLSASGVMTKALLYRKPQENRANLIPIPLPSGKKQ